MYVLSIVPHKVPKGYHQNHEKMILIKPKAQKFLKKTVKKVKKYINQNYVISVDSQKYAKIVT